MIPPESTAILVAGMHRSGTSAVTGALGLLGVSLGDNLLAPGEDNPKGYWEHQEAVDIHEHLLAALGRRWDDVRALPDGWLETGAAGAASIRIKRLIRFEFAGTHLWAIKDPRICRFLPLWIDALRQLGIRPVVLFVARKPTEVAASIEARNQWPSLVGEMLWLRHVLEAEAASRDLPRAAVIYDDLLSDPFAATSLALARLGVQVPMPSADTRGSLIRFVERGDRHHAHDAVADSGSDLSALAHQAYQALVAIAHDGSSWNALRDCSEGFDAQWRQYGAAIEAVAAMAHQFSLDEAAVRIEAIDLSSRLHAQIQWSEEAVAIRSALQSSHDQLQAGHDQLQADHDQLLANRDQWQASHDEQSAMRGQLELDLAKLQARAQELECQIEAIHQSRSWKVTRPLRAFGRLLKARPGKPGG